MASKAESLLPLLQNFLLELSQQQSMCRLAVGFSGGMDSHVLLHATHTVLQQLSDTTNTFELRALHINHGLSPRAESWQTHCEQVCLNLKVPFFPLRVSILRNSGESLEDLARQARYQAFMEQLQPQECLLMAHHQDDQAETLMLRLMRGAGPRGLAAMPAQRRLGKGLLIRPLLEVPRTLLQEYADANQLQWINDESNLDIRFDRNFVRHELFPLIAKRWPGYRQSWQRSSRLSAEADQLNQDLATLDLPGVSTDRNDQLDCRALRTLSTARQRNVIRYWLTLLGFPDPGWQVLRRCTEEVLSAAEDAQPELIWDEHELRRYNNRLYALRSLPSLNQAHGLTVAVEDLLAHRKIELPDNGLLALSHSPNAAGLRLLRLPEQGNLEITYRRGGEQCRLSGRRTRSLKKILHDAGIPPWLRDRLPLIYYENQLAFIPGAGVCEGFESSPERPGVLLEWQPSATSRDS
jgi:tRNA(Ile)-lysidine synthase